MATEPQSAPEQAAGPRPAQQTPPADLPPRVTGSAAEKPTGSGQAPASLPQHKIKRTRIGGTWIASTCFGVILLLLLIFILQNDHAVDVSYLGAHGHLPLGVALLLAAVFGVLLVALPGTARIIQLRRTARRHRKADASTATGPTPTQS